MTETDQPAAATEFALLAAVAAVQSEPAGIDTFARFVWQAKQAVRQWLTCLDESGGPLFVLCEHVDDLMLVYADRLRFVQLKTRDRGSWSATVMCDRGIDALIRSYVATRAAGLHEISTFELWLEGPTSDVAGTVRFVEDPTAASADIRAKIAGAGFESSWQDDFLGRLVIRPDQSPRADIDAKAMWEIGAIWRARSQPEVVAIYERLLNAVVAAQEAAPQPASIHSRLAAALPHLARHLPASHEPGGAAIDKIRNQVLSQPMLIALTPPRPGESAEQLLARMSAGTAASFLELKMIAAGASPRTIQHMQTLRAEMDVERLQLLESRETAATELDKLGERVLTMAEATRRQWRWTR